MIKEKHKFAYDEKYLHTEEEALELINSRQKQFYVYVLINPLNNLPFYVGKGQGGRCFTHWYEREASLDNVYKNNFMNRLSKKVDNILYVFELFTNLEQEAYDSESDLISLYGIKVQSKSNLLYNARFGSGLNSKSYTRDKWVSLFKEVHGNKYDYSLYEFRGSGIPSKIICPKHGVFERTSSHHAKGGRGCRLCGTGKVSYSEFIERSKSVHGDLYIYKDIESSNFCNVHDPVIVTCRVHGDFEIRACSHYGGQGCRKCHHANLKIINSKPKGPRLSFEEKIKDISSINPKMGYYLKVIRTPSAVERYYAELKITCRCLHCNEIFEIKASRLRGGRKHSISCSKYLGNSMIKRGKLGKLSLDVYDTE